MTVRAYAFDVVNLPRFLTERDLMLPVVDASLVFDWIDWQGVRRADRSRPGSAAASTVNRRVAAVRALFEYLVMTGWRGDNPVPPPRRGAGTAPLRARPTGSSRSRTCPSRRPVGAAAAHASGIVAGQRD